MPPMTIGVATPNISVIRVLIIVHSYNGCCGRQNVACGEENKFGCFEQDLATPAQAGVQSLNSKLYAPRRHWIPALRLRSGHACAAMTGLYQTHSIHETLTRKLRG